MRFSIGLLLACLGLLVSPAGADDSPKPEQLVTFLGHPDPVVRREAARALLRIGFDAEPALRETRGSPSHLEKVGDAERSMRRLEEAQRVRHALTLAGQLTQADAVTASFWMALDEAVREAPPDLLDDVLRLGLGDAARAQEALRKRTEAAETVATFVREWNEMSAPGTDPEKRYGELRDALVARGMAAVPPLLRILEVDPSRAFLFVDPAPAGEVSARMQVRAIFGISFLRPREAVPYLVLQAHGPSLTAASNAWAALVGIAGIEGAETGFLKDPDREQLDAWWADHRHAYASARRPLERALVETLHTSIARELVGVARPRDQGQIAIPLPDELAGLHPRQARLVVYLRLLSGDDELAYDADAPVEQRLRQAGRIAARVERARSE